MATRPLALPCRSMTLNIAPKVFLHTHRVSASIGTCTDQAGGDDTPVGYKHLKAHQVVGETNVWPGS
jgi:hypothetical protein